MDYIYCNLNSSGVIIGIPFSKAFFIFTLVSSLDFTIKINVSEFTVSERIAPICDNFCIISWSLTFVMHIFFPNNGLIMALVDAVTEVAAFTEVTAFTAFTGIAC